MNIEEISNLLEEFKHIPKEDIDTTFLEICSYPYQRFEEICSRILSFYLNPQKEHKLKNLFIDSLLKVLHKDNIISYKSDQIEVFTEYNADGKRIDVLIKSPNFVIGIENKITASLYNPLDIYRKKLNEFNVEHKIGIVLSINKITDKEEINLIKNNNFCAIIYSELFEEIKRNVGKYILTCNQKYLTQLYDFIQTIENMDSQKSQNPELDKFFFKHYTKIDDLIYWYDNHKNKNLNLQKSKIDEIKVKINEKTRANWEDWEGWDLVYKFNKNNNTIGIEANYKATEQGALGKFEIYITTWDIKSWEPYEEKIKEKYDKEINKSDGRVNLLAWTIYDGEKNQDEILDKLEECFNFLNNL